MSEPPEPPESPGSRLRREREHLGMSLQQAADDMKLDTWAIEALENDAYERMGPPVYAKGHLKKYASLLGISGDEIATGYEASRRAAASAAAPTVLRIAGRGLVRTGIARPGPTRSLLPLDRAALGRLPWRQISGAVVVAVIAAAAMWWRPWQRAPTKPLVAAHLAPVTPPQAPLIAAAMPVAAVPVAAAPLPVRTLRGGPAAPAPKASSATSASAVRIAAAKVPTPPSGLGRARLRMSFSADSWVDVRDAAGRHLYAGQGRANTVKSIGGAAPLRVYLGFASGVQLEINQRTVAIGQEFVNGDIARFQAGADGVLRRDPGSGGAPGGDAPGAPHGAFTRNVPHG